ncbi:MAG: UbiX family flavin prenyltransferase [Thermoplasmata archaeon]
MDEATPLVVGISGSSGAPIALAALRALKEARVPVSLVISRAGARVLREEAAIAPDEVAALADTCYDDEDIAAPIASGSRPTRGMAIVPCSSNTLAKVALGLGDTLLTRAAHVHLKERRRLVLVPRETPLSPIQVEHMARLSRLGVVLLEASPPYYLGFRTIDQATDFLAGKLLDQFGVPHRLYRGWRAGETGRP